MEIALKPDLEKFIAEKVTAGDYADVNEVVNGALAMMKEQDELDPDYERYLRRELAVGIEQARRGEFSEFDAEKIISEGRASLKKA